MNKISIVIFTLLITFLAPCDDIVYLETEISKSEAEPIFIIIDEIFSEPNLFELHAVYLSYDESNFPPFVWIELEYLGANIDLQDLIALTSLEHMKTDNRGLLSVPRDLEIGRIPNLLTVAEYSAGAVWQGVDSESVYGISMYAARELGPPENNNILFIEIEYYTLGLLPNYLKKDADIQTKSNRFFVNTPEHYPTLEIITIK